MAQQKIQLTAAETQRIARRIARQFKNERNHFELSTTLDRKYLVVDFHCRGCFDYEPEFEAFAEDLIYAIQCGAKDLISEVGTDTWAPMEEMPDGFAWIRVKAEIETDFRRMS